MPSFTEQLEVDATGVGSIRQGRITGADQLYKWFFNIRAVVYRFELFWVDQTVNIPPEKTDAQTGKVYHDNGMPQLDKYLSREDGGRPFIQRRVSIWDLTEKSFRLAFEGYNRYKQTSHQDDPGYTQDEMKENLLRVYPIYKQNKADFDAKTPNEKKDLATMMVKELLQTFYTEHYLMEIRRFSGIVVDPAITYNSMPLFNNERRFANAMYDGVDFEHTRRHPDEIEGHCVLRMIHDRLIGANYRNSTRGSRYRVKCQKFIAEHAMEHGGSVTIDQLIEFIQSLENVSIQVYGPLDQLIAKHQADNAHEFLACRMEDNHLFLLDRSHNASLNKRFQSIDIGDPVVLMRLLKREFTPKFNWGSEKITANPEQDMFEGEGQLYVVDEHQFEDTTAGRAMSNLMNKAMCGTRTKIRKMGWGKKGPNMFEVPGKKNMVVCESDILDRKDLVLYLKSQKEAEVPELTENSLVRSDAFEWQGQSYAAISRLIYEAMGCSFHTLYSNFRPEHYDMLTKIFKVAPMQDCLIPEENVWRFPLREDVHTYDCVRNYTSILYENTMGWNLFDEFTEVIDLYEVPDEILPGEYFIRGGFNLGHPGMACREGFYPFDFVQACLDRGFIERNNLTKWMRANHYLPGTHFRKFIEYIYNLPDNGPRQVRHKNLVNFFVGEMCRHKNSQIYNMVTDNKEIVSATVNAFGEEHVTWYDLEEDYELEDIDYPLQLVRVQFDEDQRRTAYPVVRQVYCMSWIKLADLWRDTMQLGSILLSYKSDAITIQRPRPNIPLVDTKRLEDVGKIHEEEKHLHGKGKERPLLSEDEQAKLEWSTRVGMGMYRPSWENIHVREWSEEKQAYVITIGMEQLVLDQPESLARLIIAHNKGGLITGPGGSGKSTLICEMMRLQPNHTVLCFQNVACVKLRTETGSDRVFTFDSYFQNHRLEQLNHEGGKTMSMVRRLADQDLVIVDEYTQTPPDKIKMLYYAQLESKGKLKIVLAGDQNQTQYINRQDMFRVNYTECDLVKILCKGNKYVLDYMRGITRCDEPLQRVLKELLNTRQVPEEIARPEYQLHGPDHKEVGGKAFHITLYRTGNRGWSNNKALAEYYPEEEPVIGKRIICTINVKNRKVPTNSDGEGYDSFFNGETYQVMAEDGGMYWLDGILGTEGKRIKVGKALFHGQTDGHSNFDQFHAQTVYKVQGMTLEPTLTPIVVVHLERMALEEAYTALSRCRNLSQLKFTMTWGQQSRFEGCKFKRMEYGTKPIEISGTKQFLIRGKIYQIKDMRLPRGENIIYVGLTRRTVKQEFEDIMRQTTNRFCHRPIIKYLRNASNPSVFKVELIDKLNCTTIDQLESLETEWIQRREQEGQPLKNEKKLAETANAHVRALNDADWVTPVIEMRNTNRGIYEEFLKNSINCWRIAQTYIKTRDVTRFYAVHTVTKKRASVEVWNSSKKAKFQHLQALDQLKQKIRKEHGEDMSLDAGAVEEQIESREED